MQHPYVILDIFSSRLDIFPKKALWFNFIERRNQMATITLKIVAAEMRDYNSRVAPGSECAAWQDFVADCFMRYDVAPWEEAAEEIEPVQEGVNYWLRIASGENYEYHAATGARLGI
jgi:hypothetical protein